MKPTYEVITDSYGIQLIKRTNADASIWWIPSDEANADYQAYLNRDNPDYGNKL